MLDKFLNNINSIPTRAFVKSFVQGIQLLDNKAYITVKSLAVVDAMYSKLHKENIENSIKKIYDIEDGSFVCIGIDAAKEPEKPKSNIDMTGQLLEIFEGKIIE